MGLFSKLFGAKPDKTYQYPKLGIFTLRCSKGARNLWSLLSGEILPTVTGSKEKPDEAQLEFISKAEVEIEKLQHAIARQFIEEYQNAGLQVEFFDWKEKAKIVAINVERITQGKASWMIAFEELVDPFTHLNLFIEGDELKDFSIDT